LIRSLRYLLDAHVLSEAVRPRPNAGVVDGQLAAIARTNGLVLVTANTADVRAFDGLPIAEWRT
jgi:predicted nucleic acid-binding protein